MKKRIVAIVVVCALFVGAYYLGGNSAISNNGLTTEFSLENAMAKAGNEAKLSAIEEILPTEKIEHNLALGSAEAGLNCPVSFFLQDLQNLDPHDTISMLKACNVSNISVPLVWRFLEEKEGVFDPSEYDQLLQPYVDAGFHFIFLIDAGNRHIYNQNGDVVTFSLPDWVLSSESITRQIDFLDRQDSEYGLSYSNPINQQRFLQYCEQTVTYFGVKYAESLVGFAPCIMNEFEIKYPQTQYAFTDFSNEALCAFRKYLQNKYTTVDVMNKTLATSYPGFSSVSFPVINYSNSITDGSLNDDPLFADYMQYREQAIIDYITPVYKMIRETGNTVIAYFGQPLSGHDAIYGAGVVTKLSSLIDIAVIDFNFHNGYNEVYDSIIPAMLVNYVHNAGYPEVWAGLYFERIPYLDHLDFLQQTIDYIAEDGLAKGYEIGGLLQTIRERGIDAAPMMKYGIKKRADSPKIAIYAGEWDFYKDHGEKVRYFDYFSDTLLQMYKIVRFELGYPVDVLCDEVILQDKLDQYDLLIIPTQFYVEDQVREKIEQYIVSGGKALMDLRFGEWDNFGNNTGSWSDTCFGIGGKEAFCIAEDKLLSTIGSPIGEGINYSLKSYYPAVPNVYAMYPLNEERVHPLFTNDAGKYIGLYTDNTIVLGFQPQIQYKYTESIQEQNKAVEIINAAILFLLQ